MAWGETDAMQSLRHSTLRRVGREPPLDPHEPVNKHRIAAMEVRIITSLFATITFMAIPAYLTSGQPRRS